jgi:alkylation response protein AidB-like acyl-CoA dehydrogenase
MDFSYSEEQTMLAEAVTRWLEADYGFEARREFLARPTGFADENWRRMADLGLLGLNVPGEHGGMDATPVETFIVMHAFGRALVVEPYLSTAVMAAAMVSQQGSAEQKAAVLPGIADGSRRLAVAALEPGARFDLFDVRTRARRGGEQGYVLEGRKAVVLHGDSADTLIVSARTSADVRSPLGLTLFLVEADRPGVTVRGFPTIDGQRVAEVELSGVALPPAAVLGAVDDGGAVLQWGIDRGIAALCAEAVGAMDRLIEITAEYLRTRKQFGQPIGKFQALQHRAADMVIAADQARSMALMAAAKCGLPDARERRGALSAAKALIGRTGRYVGEQAVQLHGGMGMTDELAVGHYFKRLTAIDLAWGDAQHHLESYGQLM